MSHTMKSNGVKPQTFLNKESRLLELDVGEALRFPVDEYWATNAARTRAEKQRQGAKFSIRKRGQSVYIVRTA